MAFTVSRDGGRSFLPPVRISEDGWAVDGCPDDGPAIAVDGRGEVRLAWPTVIDDQAGRRDLLHIDTRWPALHTTRPHPNARRTQTVAPSDCRRPCRTDLRRVGRKRKGTPRLGSAGVAASARSCTPVRRRCDAVPEGRCGLPCPRRYRRRAGGCVDHRSRSHTLRGPDPADALRPSTRAGVPVRAAPGLPSFSLDTLDDGGWPAFEHDQRVASDTRRLPVARDRQHKGVSPRT